MRNKQVPRSRRKMAGAQGWHLAHEAVHVSFADLARTEVPRSAHFQSTRFHRQFGLGLFSHSRMAGKRLVPDCVCFPGCSKTGTAVARHRTATRCRTKHRSLAAADAGKPGKSCRSSAALGAAPVRTLLGREWLLSCGPSEAKGLWVSGGALRISKLLQPRQARRKRRCC